MTEEIDASLRGDDRDA